jgi:uncharacterized protein
MIDRINAMLRRQPDSSADIDYLDSISDLINHPSVRSMKNYIQHRDVDCLEHSLYVSYCSYLVCKRINLNYRCAARGGLLHDFFLYDWHIKGSHKGLHGLNHPRSALQNAKKAFCLNALERDIILKHMWPLTITLPKNKEAYIVAVIDKYCAFIEICRLGERKSVRRLQSLLCF